MTLLINCLQCTFYCYCCHTKRNLACRSTKSLFSFLSTDLVVQSTDQATEGLVHVQMSWRVFLSNICHVNVVWKCQFRPLEGGDGFSGTHQLWVLVTLKHLKKWLFRTIIWEWFSWFMWLGKKLKCKWKWFSGNRRLLPIMDYTGDSAWKRGTSSELEVYRRVGNLQVEIYDSVGKLNKWYLSFG